MKRLLPLEALLAIAALGKRAYGRQLFQRLLPGIILVTVLIITAAIMTSILLTGALYVFYCALLNYGAQPFIAMLITGISCILLILMLALSIFSCMRRLHRISHIHSPLTNSAMDTLKAFTDGLMAD